MKAYLDGWENFPDYYTRLPEYEEYLPWMKKMEIFSYCHKKRIFQFWNRQYIGGLTGLIKSHPGPYLEVGAGDGMLSHWLREYGIPIRAIDDGSWKIPPVGEVENLTLDKAIRKYQPGVAVISWALMEGSLDLPLFQAKIPVVIMIGEPNGGACGSVWDGQPEELGYTREEGFEFDSFNICRTDWAIGSMWQHSTTILWRLK